MEASQWYSMSAPDAPDQLEPEEIGRDKRTRFWNQSPVPESILMCSFRRESSEYRLVCNQHNITEATM